MKALILSGGSGVRLRPLTYTGAKQLLPVANKPILFYIIEKIAQAGIREIGIIVGDTFEEVEAAVGSGELWGVDITFIRQSEPLGLAHAVKIAADFLRSDDFIMILGDNLFQMDLSGVITDFRTKAVNSMIVLHESDNPSQYGVAVVDKERVIRLVEKPKDPPSNLIITGIYIFDDTIFDAIEKTVPSQRGELEITDAIQVLVNTGGQVGYCLTEGWWKDTGSLDDLLEANRLVLDDLGGMIRTGELVAVKDSILEGPMVLGSNVSISGCRLGPYVTIGDNVTLSGCGLKDSIILDDAVIRNLNKTITSSLIGKNSSIEGGGTAMAFLVGSDNKIIL